MRRQVLLLTTSALILAYGAMAATAQGPMTPDQHHPQQTTPGQEGSMGQGGMMGRGMMGGGMMGGGMMMGPPIMMRMIFALMDADGDGIARACVSQVEPSLKLHLSKEGSGDPAFPIPGRGSRFEQC